MKRALGLDSVVGEVKGLRTGRSVDRAREVSGVSDGVC